MLSWMSINKTTHMNIAILKKATIFGLFLLAFLPLTTNATSDYDSSQNVTGATFSVDIEESTGSFKYSYPLEFPDGRKGLDPLVGIQYNSANRDNESILGFGWTLSVPYIERYLLHGTDEMYDENDFRSSLSGELEDVSLTDSSHGTYRAKVDDGSFLIYEYNTSGYWTVTDNKGTVYTFGSSASSQVYDASDSTRVYRWMLESVEDTNGNTATYSYGTDAGQIYLSEINYTGHDSDSGIFDVLFTYESRSDVQALYDTGFSIETAWRLQNIEVQENSSAIRFYEFGYDVGDNDIRSLLTSITETGYDQDGIAITKPVTTFNYSSSDRSWTQDTSFGGLPVQISNSGAGSMGVYIFDANGDSFPDIVKGRSGDQAVYLNNGDNTWTEDTGFAIPMDLAASSGIDIGVRILDLNADGFQDWVYARYGSTGLLDDAVYINNGDNTGWTQDTSISVPVGFTSGGLDMGVRVFDVNGDGLQDIVNTNSSSAYGVHINNGDGTGWTQDTAYSIPVSFVTGARLDMGVRIFDVNGDGLQDIVHSRISSGSGLISDAVYINNGDGTGWTQDTAYSVPVAFIPPAGTDMGVRMLDINSDGLLDLVYSRLGSTGVLDDEVYINNGDGTGWTEDTSAVVAKYFTNSGGLDMGVRQVDVNNDGLVDILYSRDSDPAYHELYLADGSFSDMLSDITDDSGSSMEIEYDSWSEVDGDVFFPLTVVLEITTDDGLGNESMSSYEYSSGDYYYDSEYDRTFAGFGEVSKTDDLGNVTTSYYHQGNDTDTTYGEVSDDRSKLWHIYREEIYDSASDLYKTTIWSWENEDLGNDRDFVYLQSELEMIYDGNTSHTDRATEYEYDLTDGILLSKTEYGEVLGSDDGSYVDTGDDDRTTTYEYAVDSSGMITSLPSSIVLTDSDGIQAQEALYIYDELAYGLVETGNVSEQQVWVSGSDYASTNYTYDAYGNVLTMTDPLGNVTTNVYDSYGLYPETITNALSQVKTVEYDLSAGAPTSIEEINGSITETDYDGFDRPIEQRISSATDAAILETSQTWEYDDSSTIRSVTHRSYLSDVLYTEDITYFDGLDRAIEIKTLDEDGSNYYETETSYDELGRIESVSLPEASYNSSYDGVTVSSNLYESYEYDALNRVTSVGNILGTTSTLYDGFVKTVTDPLGNQKDYETDGLGHLVEVVEYEDTVAHTTSYEWNVIDNLLSLTDASGNERSFSYDGRGLRLTAEDLHDASDATYGTWFYEYNDAGSLYSSLSPNGVTVTYYYDELNRVTDEDADDVSGIEVSYVYDTCTNGVGMLCEASVLGGSSTVYSYDATGRVESEVVSLDTIDYTTSYTYDILGNILTTTHPDGTAITNTYNFIGQLESIDGITTNFDYGPSGNVVLQENENGISTRWVYNETELYRLESKVSENTTTTSTSFYSLPGDGSMYRNGSTWELAHDATSAGGANSTSNVATVRSGITSAGGYSLNRAFLAFDTSSIPDHATITDATINVYVSDKENGDDDGDDWITIVEGLQADSSTLTTADWDDAGDSIDNPEEGINTSDRVDITSTSTGSYVSFPLNSTGLSWISLIDDTQFALREGHDVLDDPYAGSSTTSNKLLFLTSEYSGTTSDPYLTITYTESSETVQDLSYDYDAVGNIAQIIDASDTDMAKTVDYTYDDLYRLESVTVSGSADGNNGTIDYEYDAIGNITYRSDMGSYDYNETDYANPHAVTGITQADSTVISSSYDASGNMLDSGDAEYMWDYANRLISSTQETTTVTGTTTTTTSLYALSGDGSMYKNGSTWDIAHDATIAGGASATGTVATVRSGITSAGGYSLNRAFLAFDTSSIPDDATITDATINVYVSDKENGDDDGDDWITIVEGLQADSSTLTTADWDDAGNSIDNPEEGIDSADRVDTTSTSTGGYISMPLNSTGLSWISLTDDTQFALREGHDALDDPYAGSTATSNKFLFRTSEYAGTTSDPYLSITYTQPVTTTTTTEEEYAYDHGLQRVSKTTDDGTTYYPNSGYSIKDGVSTIYVNSPSGIVASIENDGATLEITTILTDHLGSTSVATDEDGIIIELVDYNPYGTERISWSSSSTDGEAEAQKTYIGEYSDDETGLSYLNARYYNPETGRFLSQDPWGGDYYDPQSLNKYSYARNNPITYNDTGGEMFGFFARQYFAPKVMRHVASNPLSSAHSATSMIPYVGDAMDVYEVVSGKNSFTGEQLSGGERVITGIAAVLPIVGGALVRNVVGEGIEAGGKMVDNIINETLSGGKNITSQFTPTVDEMLEAGESFLGGSYKELGGNGSGVFRGTNNNQFRLDQGSMSGSHSPGAPHGHFEVFDDAGNSVVNNHVKYTE